MCVCVCVRARVRVRALMLLMSVCVTYQPLYTISSIVVSSEIRDALI